MLSTPPQWRHQCDNDVVRRDVADSGGACSWAGGRVMVRLAWSAGQGGKGVAGEAAGGDGFEEVVHGACEGPFGGGLGCAAQGELPEAQVVLEVAVRGFGDVSAVPVGGHPVAGFQPGGHRGGGRPGGGLVAGGGAAAGGVLEGAALADGDQPVRAGAGQVRLGQVPGVGQDQADLASAAHTGGPAVTGPARGGLVRGDERGGVFGG